SSSLVSPFWSVGFSTSMIRDLEKAFKQLLSGRLNHSIHDLIRAYSGLFCPVLWKLAPRDVLDCCGLVFHG
ncbi:MAG TPA: hypothetical protein VKB53_08670, partial [Gammaproteobacteria bacterium]|nr:hypothetical protein [Gammaproteobacteria bacterium]